MLQNSPFRKIHHFICAHSAIEVLFLSAWVLAFIKVGGSKGISPRRQSPSREGFGSQMVQPFRTDGRTSDVLLTSIDCLTDSVELGVSWNVEAFAVSPFLEFFARTNLVDGAWELIGWTQANAGDTNLAVIVGVDQMPGRAMPSSAFFSVLASDGMESGTQDDDGDGISNAMEMECGTNPRRADTDGDGFADDVELARVTSGAVLPDFDLTSLSDVLSATLPYGTYPTAIVVDLPFALEVAGIRMTRAVVHFCGMVSFLEADPSSGGQSYTYVTTPSSLYAGSNACVAAYGYQFLSMGYSGSQLRSGVIYASNGRWFVTEWNGMVDPLGFANLTFGSATFLLAISEADPDVVFVRYVSLSGGLDGSSAIIGAHGFGGRPDLLVSSGVPGSVSTGMVVSYHWGTGTDPLNPDCDGDGLRDGWEALHGFDPLVHNDASSDPRLLPDADPDHDGLSNLRESELGTNPFQADTDGDGMDDWWESEYGFDPLLAENPEEDTDGDGLTDGEECSLRTNPHEKDSDSDGVEDAVEVSQNSDPADAEDGGRPGSRIATMMVFGDHSASQSEKYRITLTPVLCPGPGGTPVTISRISLRYDGCVPQKVFLKPGWQYMVQIEHADSNPAYTGSPKPDYDYTLDFLQRPTNVVLEDPQELFGVHNWDSGPFSAKDKVASITVYGLEFVTPAGDPVKAPNSSSGNGQNEFTYDDIASSLSLTLKVRVVPSLPANMATQAGIFTLPDIEGATLEWGNCSSGRVNAVGDEFTASATYRDYPTHNSGFGRKTVSFTVGGMTASQDFEVFFPSDGMHHPTCTVCPSCPNWFYYWKEGGVCGIASNIVFGSSRVDLAGEFSPTQGTVCLHAGAPLQSFSAEGRIYKYVVETNIIEELGDTIIVSNRIEVGRLPVGVIGAGIRAVAATVKHEMRHKTIYQVYSEGCMLGDIPVHFDEDDDGDEVLNEDECAGRWGIVTDPDSSDTFDMWRIASQYESYGDNEIRARIAEEEAISDSYIIENDWCNPGCQSFIKRGPFKDDSSSGGL